MQISAVITVIVFLAWLSTLGYRLSTAVGTPPSFSSQSAAVLQAVGPDSSSQPNGLETPAIPQESGNVPSSYSY